jgi:hypothetical protein
MQKYSHKIEFLTNWTNLYKDIFKRKGASYSVRNGSISLNLHERKEGVNKAFYALRSVDNELVDKHRGTGPKAKEQTPFPEKEVDHGERCH